MAMDVKYLTVWPIKGMLGFKGLMNTTADKTLVTIITGNIIINLYLCGMEIKILVRGLWKT